MTNEEIHSRLYEKAVAEQEQYRAWLLQQSPAEILNHTHEYTVRQDILITLENAQLSPRSAAMLYKSPSPLSEIYDAFTHMETDHMDNVRQSIDNCVQNMTKAAIQRRKEARA